MIRNLDTLPYPAFDLVGLNRYMPGGVEFIHLFTKKIKDKRIYDPKRKEENDNNPYEQRGVSANAVFVLGRIKG